MKPRDFVRQFVDQQRVRLSDPLISQSAEARAAAVMLDTLEEEYQLHLDEKLSARQMALESGFSESHIALLRRQGIISDRRRDCPRKPGHGIAPGPRAADITRPSLVDEVIGIHQRRRRRHG